MEKRGRRKMGWGKGDEEERRKGRGGERRGWGKGREGKGRGEVKGGEGKGGLPRLK